MSPPLPYRGKSLQYCTQCCDAARYKLLLLCPLLKEMGMPMLVLEQSTTERFPVGTWQHDHRRRRNLDTKGKSEKEFGAGLEVERLSQWKAAMVSGVRRGAG